MIRQNLIKAQGIEIVIHRFLSIVAVNLASQANRSGLSRYAALEALKDEPVEASIQAAPPRIV